MMSFAVRVMILFIWEKIWGYNQSLLNERMTYVCGAMRIKWAVEPKILRFMLRTTPIERRCTFIPPTNAFYFERLPQTVYRVLVEGPSYFAIWTNDGRLIVHPRESLQNLIWEAYNKFRRREHERYRRVASQDTVTEQVLWGKCWWMTRRGLTTHAPDIVLLRRKVHVLLAGRISCLTNWPFVKL